MKISELQNYEVQYQPKSIATSTDAGGDSSVPFPASPTDSGLDAGLKAVGNTPSSAIGLGKNLLSAVTNPIETGKGVFNAITGAGAKVQNKLSEGVDKLTGTEGFGKNTNQPALDTFDALKDSLVSRYGSFEAAQKTATEDPVGFGADLVGILAGGGASTVNRVSQLNSAVVSKVGNYASRKLDKAAVSQMESAIDITPSQLSNIRKTAGESPAEWLLRRDFKGSPETIIDGLSEYRGSTRSQVDEGLASIEVQIPKAQTESAQKMIQLLQKEVDGVIGLEDASANLAGLRAKDSYSLSELNEIKRLSDDYLKIFRANGSVGDAAKAKGMANVRDELKTLIEDKASENGFDSVRELNKETQVSFAIEEGMQKRLDAKSKLPEIGLRDGVLAIGGFATGGAGAAAAIVISKKVLESTTFRSHLANKIKQASPEERAALTKALETNDVTAVMQYLIPIVNEFENANPGSETAKNQASTTSATAVSATPVIQ